MAVGTTFKLSFDGASVKAGLANMKNSVESFAKNIGTAIKSIGAIAAVGVGVGAAVTALGIKLNSIGEDALAVDRRLKNITDSMGLFGDQSDEVAERLLDFSDAQGRLTGVDDDIIANTQAKLMTFKELAKSADKAGGAFDRATMAAVDMAAAGFGEAEQNAVQLGKALNDPIKGITALARAGITFTAEEKSSISAMVQKNQMLKAQETVLKAIETQVGGTAVATAKASEKIKVSMGQVVEAFAKPFSQGFDGLPGSLEGVFPAMIEKATALGVVVSNAIADSIRGNYDKMVAIGSFIYEAVATGFKASAMSLGGALWNSIADYFDYASENFAIDPISSALQKKLAGGIRGMTKDTDIGSTLRYYGEKSDLVGMGKSVMQGNQGLVPGTDGRFRFANPGEGSAFSDAAGNKVVKVLEKIERNTSEGAKF